MKIVRLFIIINLMLYAAIGATGQTACSFREAAQTKSEKKTMHIELEKFSFDVSSNLADLTVYNFNTKDEVNLDVSYSRAEGNVRDSSGSIADFRAELKSMLGEAARIESEKNTTIVNLPAREIIYTAVVENGKTLRGIVADAYDPSNNHILRMAYTKQNGGAVETAAEFEQMRNSAACAGKPSDKKSSAGYTRRFAGAITLDVKESLHPPQRFSFGSTFDKVQPDLELSFYLEPDTPPSFERDKAADEKSFGKINDEAVSSPVKNGAVEGTQYRYSLIEKPYPNVAAKEYVVRRAYIKLPNGIEVHLFGNAASERAADLDIYFTEILSSITPSEVKK